MASPAPSSPVTEVSAPQEPPVIDDPANVIINASAMEKLPPRPAPTMAYTWNEWSPKARMMYLRNADEANMYLSQLQPGCIGFDMEWKPTYVSGGRENPVALIQLANDVVIYLVQISAMKGVVDSQLQARPQP